MLIEIGIAVRLRTNVVVVVVVVAPTILQRLKSELERATFSIPGLKLYAN